MGLLSPSRASQLREVQFKPLNEAWGGASACGWLVIFFQPELFGKLTGLVR